MSESQDGWTRQNPDQSSGAKMAKVGLVVFGAVVLAGVGVLAYLGDDAEPAAEAEAPVAEVVEAAIEVVEAAAEAVEAVAETDTDVAEAAEPVAETDVDVSEAPVFVPYTVQPDIANRDEVARAMQREYPPLLRDAGIGGTALVWFYIDEAGRVQNQQINESSGHQALDDAALRVASGIRFTPALNRENPVAVWIALPITFSTR